MSDHPPTGSVTTTCVLTHTAPTRQAAAPSSGGATKRRGGSHRPPPLPSCSPHEDDEDDINGLLGLLNSPSSAGGGGGDDAAGMDYRQQLQQQRAAVCIQKHARRMLAKGVLARRRGELQLQAAAVCFQVGGGPHAWPSGWKFYIGDADGSLGIVENSGGTEGNLGVDEMWMCPVWTGHHARPVQHSWAH
jgi:hypothetical protein